MRYVCSHCRLPLDGIFDALVCWLAAPHGVEGYFTEAWGILVRRVGSCMVAKGKKVRV